MTAPRDPDRLVAAFLQDGPAELSPRLAEAIRVDVRDRRQRRPWGARRAPLMSRFTLVLAPAALLIVVVLALAGGGSTPDRTVVPPSATAGPALPTVAPSAKASPALVGAGEPWYAYVTPDDVAMLIRPDGTDPHELLAEPDVFQGLPDWSPDGSQLVFVRGYGPTSQLWLVQADGTAGRELTPRDDRCAGDCPFTLAPAFSPDGTSVAFVRNVVDVARPVSSSLVVMDLASGAERTLYTSTATDALGSPTWSPDGNRIAFEVRRFPSLGSSATVPPDGSFLALIDPHGANPTPEPIPGTESAVMPAWRPVSNELVYVHNPWIGDRFLDPEGSTSLVVRDLDGGLNVREWGLDGALYANPAWTPDGLAVTYVRAEGPGDPAVIRERTMTGLDRTIAEAGLVTGHGARLRPLP